MASSYNSSFAVSGQSYTKVKCTPIHCWCGVHACAMVSTGLHNRNAMFWSCRFNKCKFWQWFTTQALIYPNNSDQMADNQNLEVNVVNFRANDVAKIRRG